MEELRIQAEKLAEERRIAREQALEWTREVQMESDEERERKSKRASKKIKTEESGDEGAALSEPKKKRKGKLKRAGDQGGEDANEQLFSDEEVDSKPAKKVRVLLVSMTSWDGADVRATAGCEEAGRAR